MVDYQTLFSYLTPISLTIGVIYHIMTLRNTRKNQQLQLETRQAQLYMGLINTLISSDFRRHWHIAESAEWTDHADFHEKYIPGSEELTAATVMFTFFNSVGSLVKKKMIDIDLIDGSLAISIVLMWRLYEPIIIGDRDYFKTPTMWEDFEYIYREISKREQFIQTAPPEYPRN
jgi:hypothetical protein